MSLGGGLRGMSDSKSQKEIAKLAKKVEKLESAHTSLNKLCFYCFGLAFARIRELERRVEYETEINREI